MTLIENLEATRRKLVNEIQHLDDTELNKKPDPDTWSIAQVCHHLYLTEKAFTKAIIHGIKQSDGIKVEPKPFQHLAVDRTNKIKAPNIVVPGEEPLELLQILNLLNESRNLFSEFYYQLEDKAVLTENSFTHRFFGQLPLCQWAELIYLHEERHIQQIKEIKAKN